MSYVLFLLLVPYTNAFSSVQPRPYEIGFTSMELCEKALAGIQSRTKYKIEGHCLKVAE